MATTTTTTMSSNHNNSNNNNNTLIFPSLFRVQVDTHCGSQEQNLNYDNDDDNNKEQSASCQEQHETFHIGHQRIHSTAAIDRDECCGRDDNVHPDDDHDNGATHTKNNTPSCPIWIDAKSISMFVRECPQQQQQQQQQQQCPIGLGILVPPTLLADTVVSPSQQHRRGGSCCWYSLEGVKLSKLLQGIQPWLVNACTVRAIVSLRPQQDEQPRDMPADMVVLQVRDEFGRHGETKRHDNDDDTANDNTDNNNVERYRTLLNRLNGASFTTYPSHLIKAFPLLSISNTTQRDSSATSIAGINHQDHNGTPSEYQIPACPVCIHRVQPTSVGLPPTPSNTLCSNACDGDAGCRNQVHLQPWPAPSFCPSCTWIEKRYNSRNRHAHDGQDDVFCYECAMQETLWVCLICGFVGCGRYSCAHAEAHFRETNHPFSLELATLRIWNYAKEAFVHRNDLLECPLVQRHHMWDGIRHQLMRAPSEAYGGFDKAMAGIHATTMAASSAATTSTAPAATRHFGSTRMMTSGRSCTAAVQLSNCGGLAPPP